MTNRPIPCTIRGQTFPSLAAAAEHFGLSQPTLVRARQRGTLDFVGLGPRGSRGPRTTVPKPPALPWKVPCIINGQHFPTIAAAARTFNVSHTTVCGALARGRTDTVGFSKKDRTND